MTAKKPGTRKSTAKRLKLNKETLKDLAPAKGKVVRGGRAARTLLCSIGCPTTIYIP